MSTASMLLVTFAAAALPALPAAGFLRASRSMPEVREQAIREEIPELEDSPLEEDVPASYDVKVLRTFPHSKKPFTQGLEFDADGLLVETSGDYPPGVGSFVRLVDPETGLEVRRIKGGMQFGPRDRFVEGIAWVKDRWVASTYQDNVTLEYDSNFNLVDEHRSNLEGWGLARHPDGQSLLATNGSEYLMTLDPKTYKPIDAKVIQCLGRRIEGVNELEMVNDFRGQGPSLLGNVINTRFVLIINPATAVCTGVFQIRGNNIERVEKSERYGYHVANGIAYDARRGSFFVTGKNWDTMSEVMVEQSDKTDAVNALSDELRNSRPV